MAFKHINANEQIVDGSIGTSLLADGSVTSAKLAFDAITSSNFLVNSNIDFNNFQALQFRIENLNFFPVAGNPGRLIWRTDLQDIFVDSDFTLNIVSTTNLPLQIGIIADSTHMSVSSTTGMSVGDAIIQGGFPFAQVDILSTIDTTHLVVASTAGVVVNNVLVQAGATSVVTGIIDATHMTVANTNGFQPGVATVSTPYVVAIIQAITDSTHLVVDSTAGFVGQAIVSVDFGIVTITDGTHLVVDNSTAMSVGDTITQGLASTTITSVTDLTHIVVGNTSGFSVGIATVFAPVDVLAIPDSTHLVVTSTAGFGPGDPINQGLASTTVTSVIDATHLVVGNTNGFALNAAKDSTIIVDSTANVIIGMYLNQTPNSTVIVEIPDATHLAVADPTGFIAGPAFSGNWISINEGASVTGIRADNNPLLHGNIQFLSGTNTHLPQLGQTITVNVPAAGATGQLQFNLDAQNDFGADAALFWDNINKRLGIGNNAPAQTLDVTGTANVSGAVTAGSTLDVTGLTTLHDNLHVVGTSNQDGAVVDGSTLDVTGATTLHSTLDVTAATTLHNTLDVTAATSLHNTLAVTNLATFSGQVGIGTLTPDASASLDVTSITRGALVPRMTTVQRDAIVSPAVGLLIYNLDSNLFNFWTGASWLPVGSPVGNVGDVQFNAGGGLFGANPNFFWDIANARLGIGNAAPTTALDVTGTVTVQTGDISLDDSHKVIFGNSGNAWLRWRPEFGAIDIHGSNSGQGLLAAEGQIYINANAGPTGAGTYQPYIILGNPGAGDAEIGVANNLTVDDTNGSYAAQASAVLQVESTTRGLLPPRLTTVQRDAIVSPASGLIIYNITTNDTEKYDGSSWKSIGSVTADQTIVFGNTNADYTLKYSTPHGGLLFTSEVTGNSSMNLNAPGNFLIWANTNADGSGTYEPNIQLGTDGRTIFSNETTGTRQVIFDMFDGVSICDFGINGPVASSILDLRSTTKGFLAPQMTTVQRDAIASPAIGLQIYNTTTNQEEYYNGTIWAPIGNTAVAGTNGQFQYNNNGVFGATSNLAYDPAKTTVLIGSPLTTASLSSSAEFGSYFSFLDAAQTVSAWSVGPGQNYNPGGGPNDDSTFLITTANNGSLNHPFVVSNSADGTTFHDFVFSPTGQIGVGPFQVAIDPSAVVDVQSTTRGLLTPRMTTVQRDAIASPAIGLQIYNTDTNDSEKYDGTSWKSIGSVAIGQRIYFRSNVPSDPNDVSWLEHSPSSNQWLGQSDFDGLEFGSAGEFGLFGNVQADGNGTYLPEIWIGASNGSGSAAISAAGSVIIQTDATKNGAVHVSDNSSTGVAANAIQASAILQTDSTTKGFLPPRMTSAQRDAIVTPAFPAIGFFQASNFTTAAGGTITVNGVTLTEGVDWNAAIDNANTACSIAAAIKNNGGTACTAFAVGNAVYVLYGTPGTAGNGVTYSSAAPGIIASGGAMGFGVAATAPATGLIIYNTDLNNLQEYNGTAWRNVAPLYQQDIFHPSGPGNVFTLTFTPIANSQAVFYNGLALAPGATEDYTISGNVVTLNAGIVLTNGDKILVTYSY